MQTQILKGHNYQTDQKYKNMPHQSEYVQNNEIDIGDEQIFYTIISDSDIKISQEELQLLKKMQNSSDINLKNKYRQSVLHNNQLIREKYQQRRRSEWATKEKVQAKSNGKQIKVTQPTTCRQNPEILRQVQTIKQQLSMMSEQKKVEYSVKVMDPTQKHIHEEKYEIQRMSLRKIDIEHAENNGQNFEEQYYVLLFPQQMKISARVIDTFENNNCYDMVSQKQLTTISCNSIYEYVSDEKQMMEYEVKCKQKIQQQLNKQRQIQNTQEIKLCKQEQQASCIKEMDESMKQQKEKQLQDKVIEYKKQIKIQSNYKQNMPIQQKNQNKVQLSKVKQTTQNQPSSTIKSQGITQSQIDNSPRKTTERNSKVYQSQFMKSKQLIPQIHSLNKIQILIGSCYFIGKLKNPQNQQFAKIKYQLSSHNLRINNQDLLIPYLSISKIKLMAVTLTNSQKEFITCKQKYLAQLKITYVKQQGSSKQNKKSPKEQIIFLVQSYEVIFSIYSSIIVRKLLVADSSSAKQIDNSIQHNIRMILSQYNLAVTCFMDKSQYIKHVQKQVESKNIEYKCPQFSGILFRKGRLLKKWETKYIQIADFQIKQFKDTQLIQMKTKEELIRRGFMQQKVRQLKIQKLKQQTENYLKSKKKQPTPQLVINKIQQIWTRFEFYHSSLNEANDQPLTQIYLIIKIHYSDFIDKTKAEFAIPILNYADIYHSFNWLYGLGAILAVTNHKQ